MSGGREYDEVDGQVVGGLLDAPGSGSAGVGRPSAYTPDTEEAILTRIYAGESLRSICRDPDLPAESTVYRWLSDPRHPFSEKFARAREGREWGLIERMEDLAKLVVSGRMDAKVGYAAATILDKALARMASKNGGGSGRGGRRFEDGDGEHQTGVLVIETPSRSYEEACARVGQRPSYIDRLADGLVG